jgi:hypothetical protein
MTRIFRNSVFNLLAAVIAITVLPNKAGAAATNLSSAEASIPYVPTRHDTVRDLLWIANVGTNDVVYDLGSGDGRRS